MMFYGYMTLASETSQPESNFVAQVASTVGRIQSLSDELSTSNLQCFFLWTSMASHVRG